MGGADAEPLALFRTIAHHPELLDRFRQIGSTLLSFGRLAADERETMIQRTTARCGASYEWGVHAAGEAGRAVGPRAARGARLPRRLLPPRGVRLWGFQVAPEPWAAAPPA